MVSLNAKKVPVLERTLIKRINRSLEDVKWRLFKNKKSRSKRAKLTEREKRFGTYFVVYDDVIVKRTHVDLEAFARECGVLRDFEVLAPDGVK
jgi:hypothetical protein